MKTAIKNINNKKLPSYFFVVIFVIAVFIVPSMVLAADATPAQTGTYTLLAPLPLSGGATSDTTVTLGGEEQFRDYLNNAFKIGITIAILLAVIMIVIGGIQWMGESVFGKEAGKKKIQDAIWGLVLALAIFLILNTINPDLVNLRLNVENLAETPAYQATVVPAGSVSAGASQGVIYKPCADCVTVASLNLPTKQPGVAGGGGGCLNTVTECMIGRDIGTKLQTFNQEMKTGGISWTTSESWPPTRTHKEEGQKNGTSVDISIGQQYRTPEAIVKAEAAATTAGLRFQYEVPTQARAAELKAQGVNVIYVSGITGEHASIYNRL